MCLAIPGKIIEIKDDIATVDYEAEKREARILEPKFKVGDYVIVQVGIVMAKIDEKEAKESLRLIKEL